MKDFSQFIKEEISIKGNKGVPDEKIRDIERKGGELVGRSRIQELGPRIMELIGKSMPYTRGKEKQLEKLAEEIIRDAFKGILDNVDLNINLLSDGNKVDEFMKKEEEEKKAEEEESQEESEEESQEAEEQPSPEEIKLAVDKRKIMNNIIQGEAKNTKHILHSEIAQEGLKKIYGDKWREIFNIWDEISKIADKMDWIIPINTRAQQMEDHPGGMAGACSIRWPKKEKEEGEEDKKSEEAVNDLLKSLEMGTDINEKEEEIKELIGDKNPIVKSRGIDFPMLLHETVKGIYEMIADIAMPKSKALATIVQQQTSSFADEVEDWRYGPYLAKDITEFINKNEKVIKYPNIKEFVFGKLIDSDRWSDEECLVNLKNVFLESPSGRKLIDDLIDETIEELDKHKQEVSEWEDKKKESEEDDKYRSTDSGEEVETEETPVADAPKGEVDMSTLSQREIQKMIDDALDNEDWEEVHRLSNFLKEGKEIYLKELERINENKQHRK